MIAMRLRYALPLLLAIVVLSLVAACGGDDGNESPTVTPETPTSVAPSPTAVASAATPTPEPSPTEAPPEPTPPPPEPTLPPPPPGPTAVAAPAVTQRWIDVNVTTFVVRLMEGETVLREIAPVGVGVQIDTGEYLSTQTGVFAVHNKNVNLVYDAPFDTYISHWVGFDAEKDNGFHSFLKDAVGNVVDASTGRVSNGCIRIGDAAALFDFAEIGMTVVVRA